MSTFRRLLRRLLSASLLALAFPLVGCFPVIQIQTPQPQDTVVSCDVEAGFTLTGAFLDEPAVTLNFVDVGSLVTEGPPGTYQLTLGPEDGLGDENVLLVSATRATDGKLITQGDVGFSLTRYLVMVWMIFFLQ